MQEELPLHGPPKPELPASEVPPIDQIAVAGRAVVVELGVGLGLATAVGVALGLGVGEAPVGVALGPDVPDGVGVLAGARCGVSTAFPGPQPEVTTSASAATAVVAIRRSEARMSGGMTELPRKIATLNLSGEPAGAYGVKPYCHVIETTPA
jgi:hypothetical protein